MSQAFPFLGWVEPKKELDSSKLKPLPNFRSGLHPQNNYLKNEGIENCKIPATASAANPLDLTRNEKSVTLLNCHQDAENTVY